MIILTLSTQKSCVFVDKRCCTSTTTTNIGIVRISAPACTWECWCLFTLLWKIKLCVQRGGKKLSVRVRQRWKSFFLIPKYNASFSSRLHDCIRVVVLMYLHMQILNIIPGDEVKLFLTKEHTHICYLLHFVHIINEEKKSTF